MRSLPLAVDLFCGLGGWSSGFLLEGYDVVGFDIEHHIYGEERYPAQLVIQDVLTIHGSQFRDAAIIVASPPCQEYSYMAMPWSLAKAKAQAYRDQPETQASLTALFRACFRIQREASEAAGHHVPLIVENVRGAQPWVGKAQWNFGSYYLWGDVPALMPIPHKARKFNPDGTGHPVGSWFAIADSKNRGASVERSEGFKSVGLDWSNRDQRGNDFTRIAGQQSEGVKVASVEGRRTDVGNGTRFTSRDCGMESEGVKQPGITGGRANGKGNRGAAASGSKSLARKAASARIAMIPLPLARHIARVYYYGQDHASA